MWVVCYYFLGQKHHLHHRAESCCWCIVWNAYSRMQNRSWFRMSNTLKCHFVYVCLLTLRTWKKQTITMPLNQRYRPIATVNLSPTFFNSLQTFPCIHTISFSFTHFLVGWSHSVLVRSTVFIHSVARILFSLNKLVAIHRAHGRERMRQRQREREIEKKKLISEIPHIFFPARSENIPFESLLSNYLAI